MNAGALIQALRKRLDGSVLKFEEKLLLSERILVSGDPSLDGIIIEWILKTLEYKKSTSDAEELRKKCCRGTSIWEYKKHFFDYLLLLFRSLWKLLDKAFELEEYFLTSNGFQAETLVNIIMPSNDPEVRKLVWKTAKRCLISDSSYTILKKQPEILRKIISDLILHFGNEIRSSSDNDEENTIQLLIKRLPFKEEEDDGFILSLLQDFSSFPPSVKNMIRKRFFSQELVEDWKKFLHLLFHNEDFKPPVSICRLLNIFKDSRIHLCAFLPRLFSCIRQYPSKETCLIFIFFLHLVGFNPLDLIKRESIWIAAYSKGNKDVFLDSKDKCGFLVQMIENLNNMSDFDVKFEILEEVTFLKFSQYLVKELIPETAIYASAVNKLIQLNPCVIEPLIGSYATYTILYQPEGLKILKAFRFLIGIYSKLRLIPKLFAKMMIYLSNHPEKTICSTRIDSETWEFLSSEFQLLPYGQTVELWKSFVFHLDDGKDNVVNFIDIIMPVFIRRCRIVDHSVPDGVVEKVKDLIIKTSTHLHMIPMTKEALIDLALLLLNVRGLNVLSLLKDSPANPLQKIKWAEITGENLRFTEKDLEKFDLCHYPIVTPFCDTTALEKLTKKIISNDEDTSECIEEDKILQASIAELLKTKLTACLGFEFKKNRVKALNAVTRDDTRKCKISESNIFELGTLLRSYLQLPLEYLECKIREDILSICLELLFSFKVGTMQNNLFLIIARCMDRFKFIKIFEKVDVGLITIKIIEITEDSLSLISWKQKATVLFIEYSVTHMKMSQDLKHYIERFVGYYEEDLSRLNAVIFLLDSISRIIISQNNKKRTEKYEWLEHNRSLFSPLSKGLLHRVKCLNNEDRDVVYSLLKGVTAVIKALQSEGKTTKLKKWVAEVENFFYFSIDEKEDEDGAVTDFLRTLCDNYNIFEDSLDISAVWLKVKSNRYSYKDQQLLESLFRIPNEDAVRRVLEEIFSATKNTPTLEEHREYIKIWQSLVQAQNLPSEILPARRMYIEKILHFYHDLVVVRDLPFQSIISVLKFEHAILDSEKPVINKEAEATCLITSLFIKFADRETEEFLELWNHSYEILLTAFHKRPSSLIIPRVAVVTDVIRNLIRSLAGASNQSENPFTPTEISKLSLCARRVDRITECVRKNREDFRRVSSYLIADILDQFQKFKVHSEVKSNLMFAIYKLLDICDKHAIAFLSGSLPPELEGVFKQIYDNYLQYHKYTGKI